MTTYLQPWHGRIGMTALAGVLLLASCSKTSDRKPVFPVRGQVLVQGKPAAGAYVAFHPVNDLDNPRRLRALGIARPDGTFEASTYLPTDGVPAGEYAVTIYWPGPLPPDAQPGDFGPDLLKLRYMDPKKPFCHVTIGS